MDVSHPIYILYSTFFYCEYLRTLLYLSYITRVSDYQPISYPKAAEDALVAQWQDLAVASLPTHGSTSRGSEFMSGLTSLHASCLKRVGVWLYFLAGVLV